jgi:hypothetical protein
MSAPARMLPACNHERRALGWAILCCGEVTDYGEDSDNKTLDAIGHDLDELIRSGQHPMLLSVGDCIDCRMVEMNMADEIRNRYRVRFTLGRVTL